MYRGFVEVKDRREIIGFRLCLAEKNRDMAPKTSHGHRLRCSVSDLRQRFHVSQSQTVILIFIVLDRLMPRSKPNNFSDSLSSLPLLSLSSSDEAAQERISTHASAVVPLTRRSIKALVSDDLFEELFITRRDTNSDACHCRMMSRINASLPPPQWGKRRRSNPSWKCLCYRHALDGVYVSKK